MKKRIVLSLVATLLVGCHPKSPVIGSEETASLHLFEPGKGVAFSQETKKLFELEISEVAEKPIGRRFEKTAQVYRTDVGLSWAMLLLDDKEISSLKVGQIMQVKVPARAKDKITGKLVRIDRQAASALGKGEGLVEFEDPEHLFEMGQFLPLSAALGEEKTALIVPLSAILVTAEGNYVYVVNGKYLSRTRIKTGASDNGMVEVENGLYSGDSIVTKGVESLWLVELSALKGGTPCCPPTKKT